MSHRVGNALLRLAWAERGSGLVEFAFVAPIFLLLVFAIVDFGRALYTYDLVSNDARLGTRYAMVRGAIGCAAGMSDCTLVNGSLQLTQASLQQHLRDLSTGIDTSQLTVRLTRPTSPGCITSTTVSGAAAYPNGDGPGCLVSVQVSYPFAFAALSGVQFAPVPMSSTSQIAISQ